MTITKETALACLLIGGLAVFVGAISAQQPQPRFLNGCLFGGSPAEMGNKVAEAAVHACLRKPAGTR